MTQPNFSHSLPSAMFAKFSDQERSDPQRQRQGIGQPAQGVRTRSDECDPADARPPVHGHSRRSSQGQGQPRKGSVDVTRFRRNREKFHTTHNFQ